MTPFSIVVITAVLSTQIIMETVTQSKKYRCNSWIRPLSQSESELELTSWNPRHLIPLSSVPKSPYSISKSPASGFKSPSSRSMSPYSDPNSSSSRQKSPTIGQKSSSLSQNLPSSSQNLPSSSQNLPSSSQSLPSSSQNLPSSSQNLPSSSQNLPSSSQNLPSSSSRSPYLGPTSSSSGQKSPSLASRVPPDSLNLFSLPIKFISSLMLPLLPPKIRQNTSSVISPLVNFHMPLTFSTVHSNHPHCYDINNSPIPCNSLNSNTKNSHVYDSIPCNTNYSPILSNPLPCNINNPSTPCKSLPCNTNNSPIPCNSLPYDTNNPSTPCKSLPSNTNNSPIPCNSLSYDTNISPTPCNSFPCSTNNSPFSISNPQPSNTNDLPITSNHQTNITNNSQVPYGFKQDTTNNISVPCNPQNRTSNDVSIFCSPQPAGNSLKTLVYALLCNLLLNEIGNLSCIIPSVNVITTTINYPNTSATDVPSYISTDTSTPAIDVPSTDNIPIIMPNDDSTTFTPNEPNLPCLFTPTNKIHKPCLPPINIPKSIPCKSHSVSTSNVPVIHRHFSVPLKDYQSKHVSCASSHANSNSPFKYTTH